MRIVLLRDARAKFGRYSYDKIASYGSEFLSGSLKTEFCQNSGEEGSILK